MATTNVGSIMPKLQLPDFIQFIKKHVIVCIVETYIDIFDSITIWYLIRYIQTVKENLGGISLIYKKWLKDMIDIKESKNNLVLWFTFEYFSSTIDNVLFGGVYLPQEGSVYACNNMFEEIEHDLHTLYINDDPFFVTLTVGQQRSLILTNLMNV